MHSGCDVFGDRVWLAWWPCVWAGRPSHGQACWGLGACLGLQFGVGTCCVWRLGAGLGLDCRLAKAVFFRLNDLWRVQDWIEGVFLVTLASHCGAKTRQIIEGIIMPYCSSERFRHNYSLDFLRPSCALPCWRAWLLFGVFEGSLAIVALRIIIQITNKIVQT